MIYILLRVLFQTVFAQSLRYGQVGTGRVLVVAFVNYAFATLFCAVLAVGMDELGFSRTTLLCGLVGGVTYLIALVLTLPAMRQSGVSVSVAVLQLSVLVPVVYAIAAFGERPSPAQIVGLVLAVAALVILSFTTSAADATDPARFSPILIPLFLVCGLSGVSMKLFQETGPPEQRMSFNAILFGMATVTNVVALALPRAVGNVTDEARIPKQRPLLAAIGMGLVMGAANSGQLICLMLALATAPAVLVFPVSSALSLVANALVSAVLWGETLRPAGWLGLGLAVVASVLLNVGG
jgi:drug/metabolite transporter (DMT)-like permease